jgi:YjbE family integral membrane protein
MLRAFEIGATFHPFFVGFADRDMTLENIAAIAQIILIDIVLSGDNAVVIAMAAHKLPAYQRQRAIFWGGAIAIAMRIVFTLVMAFLLMVPGVRLIGGLVLTWIACKLLLEEEDHEISPDDADRTALAAIRMIFVADFVMSLDNMLAVAGASHGNWMFLLAGLLISIGIIMTCSAFIARLMNRFKWIVYLGAAILAFTAGEMMMGDRELAGYIVRNYGVSLNRHWLEDYMLTHAHVKGFEGESLPENLRDVVQVESGKITFIGQMNEEQRDALLERVTDDKDREAIGAMYEQSYRRPVPGWVPESLRSNADRWVQRKWPAEDYRRVEGNHYHYVAWAFYGLVIGACLTSPYWLKRRKATEPSPPSETA